MRIMLEIIRGLKHIDTRRYFVRKAVTNGRYSQSMSILKTSSLMGWRRRYNLLYIGHVWKLSVIVYVYISDDQICMFYLSYVFFSMYWLILWLLCISLHVCKHLYILVAIFMYTIHVIVYWSIQLVMINLCLPNRDKDWGDVLASHHICTSRLCTVLGCECGR